MESCQLFRQTLQEESKALEAACQRIESSQVKHLEEIYRHLIKEGGQLIFSGVGKSGLVGMKCASTFSSLGLSSFFLHPNEALHGDLGRVGAQDAIVWLSKSGETEEILKLMPFISLPKERNIGLLGKIDSSIGKQCGLVFDCSVEKEACLNNLAPTTSSTLTMAMGDGMAVVFEKQVNLSREKYALNHPGGILGKSLLLKVESLMTPQDKCPTAGPDDPLIKILPDMTTYNVGACAVCEGEKFVGLLVEGDIRRTMNEDPEQGLKRPLRELMTQNPISCSPDDLVVSALQKMKSTISVMPVLEGEKFKGFIHLHDILKEGLSFSS